MKHSKTLMRRSSLRGVLQCFARRVLKIDAEQGVLERGLLVSSQPSSRVILCNAVRREGISGQTKTTGGCWP